MGTLAQIADQPDTPLTALEVEKAREIVSGGRLVVTRESVIDALADLTPTERQATRQDLADWDELGFGTEKIRPSSGDGLDYDAERDRAVIRRRLVIRLGYDPAMIGGGLWGVAKRC